MHANQQTLEIFYMAFARLDADAIAGMWRMLCEATRDKGAGGGQSAQVSRGRSRVKTPERAKAP